LEDLISVAATPSLAIIAADYVLLVDSLRIDSTPGCVPAFGFGVVKLSLSGALRNVSHDYTKKTQYYCLLLETNRKNNKDNE